MSDAKKINVAQLRREAEEKPARGPAAELLGDGDTHRLLLHELEVHQVEPELQNDNLHQTQAELEASHNRYRDLYEFAPAAYLTLTCEGRIAEINLTGAVLLGMERQRLLQRHFSQFVAVADRDNWHRQFPDTIRGVQGMQIELSLKRMDGSEFCALLDCLANTAAEGRPAVRIVVTDISERKKADAALQASNLRFRTVFEKAFTGMAIADPVGTLLEANDSLAAMLGYTREELVGSNIERFTHADDLARELVYLREIYAGKRDDYRMDKRYLTKSGALLWVDLLVNVIRNEQGHATSLIGLVMDITERKRAEADLRLAAAAFESQEGMVVTDPAGVILRVNLAFTAMTGFSADELVGQQPRLFHSLRHDDEFCKQMFERSGRTGNWQGEVWGRRKNGEEFPSWLTLSAVRDSAGALTHFISTHVDITERKQAEARIHELAFFDPLTGLPNRTLLLDRLKQTMTASSRGGSYAALLFIDLDNFKSINDTLGHDVGDLLLKQVAARLLKCVREGDTVARLGGDEFVVILKVGGTRKREAASLTEMVATKILATLDQVYRFDGIAHHSAASIGICLFNGTQTAIDELMKQADLAMYKAKTAGKNTLRFFDPAMEIAVRQRSALEDELRRSLEAKQFVLHYQAQVVDAGRVTGAEVLVRWQHPERGMVSPAEFIPLAEESRLILPLGEWVLETACARLALWASRPEMADLTLAVNVSATQFREPGFVAQVLAILASTGANPRRLKLELTESLLIHDVEQVIQKMFALKAQGVSFALDDFGTGYSSLSYLKRLPLDQLKIDQTFVSDVLTDPNDATIARTIVALGRSLGLGVIAEGVETAAQRDFLASSGCNAYQGYFFSRPLAVDGFEEFALLAAVAPGIWPFESSHMPA